MGARPSEARGAAIGAGGEGSQEAAALPVAAGRGVGVDHDACCGAGCDDVLGCEAF
jgi:hypothetical protein